MGMQQCPSISALSLDGQGCLWVPQPFAGSTLFFRRHASCEHSGASLSPHSALHNSSRGWYRSILLVSIPPTLSRRGHPFCVQASGYAKSLPAVPLHQLLGGGVLVCILWRPAVSALTPGGMTRGNVPQRPVGRPEKLVGAPVHSPPSRERETVALTSFSGPGWFPQLPESLVVLKPAPCRPFLLLVVQKLFDWLAVVSPGSALNISVHWTCTREWGAQHPSTLPAGIHPSLLCVESINIAE